MSGQSATEKFVFNENFDNAFIFNLYEDDYGYIAEVFANSLETFDSDVDEIEKAFKTGDLELLRRAVHKIKPVFGFCGLVNHQSQIGNFEKTCSLVTGTGFVIREYDQLLTVINEGKQLIDAELKSLTAFIK